MKNHVMLDIETLGVNPGSIVLSVAAVAFDPYGSVGYDTAAGGFEIVDTPQFYEVIDTASYPPSGQFRIEPGTVEFWMKQNDKVRFEAFGLGSQPKKDLEDVLIGLSNFFERIEREYGETFVWSHGAGFDVPLLSEVFLRNGIEAPWQFRNVRDTRTIIDLCKPNLARGGLPRHHPLYDAIFQARQMQHSLQWIAEATGWTVKLDSTRQQ